MCSTPGLPHCLRGKLYSVPKNARSQEVPSSIWVPSSSQVAQSSSPSSSGREIKCQDPKYHIKSGFQGRLCPFFAASVAVPRAKAMLVREAQGDQTGRCHFSMAEQISSHELRPDETDKDEELRLEDQSQLPSPCLSSVNTAVAWDTWHNSPAGSSLQPLTTKAGEKGGI